MNRILTAAAYVGAGGGAIGLWAGYLAWVLASAGQLAAQGMQS